MVAKVAGGIIGLGLIGTGSVAMAKPEWFGINREISWTPLSQDKDFSDSEGGDYKDKFGSTYKNYLTGVKGKENKINDSWWEESFKKLKKDKEASASLGNGFKETITGAVKPSGETDGNKYLNEICDTIYKLGKEKVKPEPGSDKSDEYKESEVWKYCSPLGQKPTTVQVHDRSGSDKKYESAPEGKELIGKAAESDLISVNDKNNDKFWDIRNQEFHSERLFKNEGGITVDSTNHKFFDAGKTAGTHIKKLCEEAYKQEKENSGASSEPKATSDETKKYCSLDKK